eukprot:1844285-Rhodomonas_salina.1
MRLLAFDFAASISQREIKCIKPHQQYQLYRKSGSSRLIWHRTWAAVGRQREGRLGARTLCQYRDRRASDAMAVRRIASCATYAAPAPSSAQRMRRELTVLETSAEVCASLQPENILISAGRICARPPYRSAWSLERSRIAPGNGNVDWTGVVAFVNGASFSTHRSRPARRCR